MYLHLFIHPSIHLSIFIDWIILRCECTEIRVYIICIQRNRTHLCRSFAHPGDPLPFIDIDVYVTSVGVSPSQGTPPPSIGIHASVTSVGVPPAQVPTPSIGIHVSVGLSPAPATPSIYRNKCICHLSRS